MDFDKINIKFYRAYNGYHGINGNYIPPIFGINKSKIKESTKKKSKDLKQ